MPNLEAKGSMIKSAKELRMSPIPIRSQMIESSSLNFFFRTSSKIVKKRRIPKIKMNILTLKDIV